MYRRKPSGDYQVGVCTNTLCAVMGGDAIFDELKEHLGVGNDETTEDGKVTLEHIECNAACDFAPVVMVNWEFFDNQTPRVRQARSSTTCAPGATVEPTRGAPLCTFKETARILAGFPDERPGAVEATGGAGPASLAGLRLAKGEARPREVVRSAGGDRRTPSAAAAAAGAAEHLSSHDAPQETSRPTRRTRPDPQPRRGSDDLGSRRRRRRPAPRSCSRPSCPPSGTSPSPGRWTPTAGTTATRACARPSPWRRTTSSRTSRTPGCAAAAAPASPPA